MLAAIVLTFDHDASREMRNAYGGIGLVDVLAAGTGGAISIDAQVGGVDVDVLQLIGFRHHGDGACRGVNAALGFCRWYALYAMAAGFEFQF